MAVARIETDIFSDLENLCATSGYIHVLALLSFRDNYVSYVDKMTSEALAASYGPQRRIRTEISTLVGLMLRQPVDWTLPEPTVIQHLIAETTRLLDELHGSLSWPMFAAIQDGDLQPGQSPFGQGKFLREPIFYGGESAYSFQYRDFALIRYKQDEDWALFNKGFGIAEAHAIAEAISRIQGRKIVVALAMREQDPVNWTVMPGFTFTLDEIARESGLMPKRCATILAAFSTPPAPTNDGFTSLGEFNVANAMPILSTPSGGYVCLQAYVFVEALYDTTYYWMAADPKYRESAFRHRGEFTEEIVSNRLTDVFGTSRVFSNVVIYSGATSIGEIDVLVLFADRAVVVQCKSKKLTIEARKGNDLQIRDDFKKAVQNAYDQGLTCAKALGEPAFRFVCARQNDLKIPKLKEIYIVCVVSDHYPALAVQCREFLRFETTEVVQPPLVADVFLIDVLAEMLASPLRLLSYLNRRVNYGNRVFSINELTTLSHHLSNNLWLDDKTDIVVLDEALARDLDAAMMVRREGLQGARTPKGILTRLEGTLIGRIIAAIEHQAKAALVDLGFLLLTLGAESIANLDRGLAEVFGRTRMDGRRHNFTIVFGDSEAGLTVHCSRFANEIEVESLQDHCHQRKYIHRAKSWFGLAVRADDGLPKFGIQLQFPWVRDSDMDARTIGMDRNGSGGGHPNKAMAQIGRNSPCPCRSGKKYKKCCLR